MERLPTDLCLKIFSSLDHQNLAAVQLVCRKWQDLASDDILWADLFEGRWGTDRATFYAPIDSKSWKDVYIVQDRCDRIGLGLKIIREGDEYLLVHQGEIQRHLGSRRQKLQPLGSDRERTESVEEVVPHLSILDKILFFIADMESASMDAKRGEPSDELLMPKMNC